MKLDVYLCKPLSSAALGLANFHSFLNSKETCVIGVFSLFKISLSVFVCVSEMSFKMYSFKKNSDCYFGDGDTSFLKLVDDLKYYMGIFLVTSVEFLKF